MSTEAQQICTLHIYSHWGLTELHMQVQTTLAGPQPLKLHNISPQPLRPNNIAPQLLRLNNIAPQPLRLNNIAPQALRLNNIAPQALGLTKKYGCCIQGPWRSTVTGLLLIALLWLCKTTETTQKQPWRSTIHKSSSLIPMVYSHRVIYLTIHNLQTNTRNINKKGSLQLLWSTIISFSPRNTAPNNSKTQLHMLQINKQQSTKSGNSHNNQHWSLCVQNPTLDTLGTIEKSRTNAKLLSLHTNWHQN